MADNVRGRNILVTGVTSGIGRALCTQLVGSGHRVIGLARSAHKLSQVGDALGPGFSFQRVDLADPASVSVAVDKIVDRHDHLDAIVNNAATCVYETPLELETDGWQTLVQTNLLSVIALTKGLAKTLSAGGQIINVSSVTAGRIDHPRFAPYGLTKAALSYLSDALRLELGGAGIRVTQIRPGLVDTEIYDKVEGFAHAREHLKKMIPRWLDASDVAEAISWILDRPRHVVVGEMTLLPIGQAF